MNELMEHDDFSGDISSDIEDDFSDEHEHEQTSEEHIISIVAFNLDDTCKVLP